MREPEWIKTASDNAMLSRAEVVMWLGIPARDLVLLIRNQGFPPPRIYGARSMGRALAAGSRWRVGDVKKWLSRDMEQA